MLLPASPFFLPWGGGGGRDKVSPPNPPRSHLEEHKQGVRSQLPFLPLLRVGRPPPPARLGFSSVVFTCLAASYPVQHLSGCPSSSSSETWATFLLSLRSQGSQMRLSCLPLT